MAKKGIASPSLALGGLCFSVGSESTLTATDYWVVYFWVAYNEVPEKTVFFVLKGLCFYNQPDAPNRDGLRRPRQGTFCSFEPAEAGCFLQGFRIDFTF